MKLISGAPAEMAGARPSPAALGEFGTYVGVESRQVCEGDVVLYDSSLYSVVKKTCRASRGLYVILRELVTNDLRTVRMEPGVKLSRFDAEQSIYGEFDGRMASWTPSVGDVVLYPGIFTDGHVLAVRNSSGGWHRTEAPWTSVADAEVILDVTQGKALMVRSNVRAAASEPPEGEFPVGMVVVTRDRRQRDPSVWFRQFEDCWVTNARGVHVSDQMIRYELERGTYQALSLPEDS
jgi:hypothetical protein